MLEIGGQAVYIPLPGARNEPLQMEEPRPGSYVRLEHIGQLPEWLEARLLAA